MNAIIATKGQARPTLPSTLGDSTRGLGKLKAGDWITLGSLLLISSSLYLWLATVGTWNLFVPAAVGSYYDSLAKSLTKGSLEVEPSAIGGEAMIHDNKHYGYFAFGPAVPRILLNKLWPRLYGLWSRLSVVLAGVAQVLFAALLLVRFGAPLSRPLTVFFLASVAFGSTLVYIVSNCYVYHEAIVWGAAFALASAFFSVSYLARPSVKLAIGAASCGLVASWCRITAGIAALLACAAVLAWTLAAISRHQEPVRLKRGKRRGQLSWHGPDKRSLKLQAAILVSGIVLGFGSYVWLNYVRFGTILDGMPVKLSVSYIGQRYGRIDGRLFHPEFAPAIASEYWSPVSAAFRPNFPWFGFTTTTRWSPSPKGFDLAEPYAGVPSYTPGLVLLALMGIFVGVHAFPNAKWLRGIVLALAAPIPIVCCDVFMSHRYEHDWFPLLVVAGAVGVAWLQAQSPPRFGRLWKVLVSILLLWSIPASLSLALIFQREVTWGIPEAQRVKYGVFQQKVDNLFRPAPSHTIQTTPR